MTVSILIPIYNVAPYIEACARSLFEQTYTDIEYIFVDDCSPDNSVDIQQRTLTEYPTREGQVRIIRHEQNRGVGAARATALAQATGETLMFVDSDDLLPIDAVERLVDKMKQTDADIVEGNYANVESIGLVPRTSYLASRTSTLLKLLLIHNVESNRLWGRLYRRSLFSEHQIDFEPGIDYGEDYAVVPRLLFFGRRVCISDVCYYYRTDNQNSYTHTISPKANASFLRSNRKIVDFFAENDTKGEYSIALRMGIVDLYRHARRFGTPLSEVDRMFPERLSCPMSRFIIWLYRQRWGYRPATLLYLASRRIYIACLKLKGRIV